MRIIKSILLLLFILLYGLDSSVYAQQLDRNPLLRKAYIEYQSLRFTAAIKELEKVMKKDPSNINAIEMMAGSNRNIKNYDEALYWYGELCKEENIKPEWALYYAEALANKEKYEQSEQWYRKFLSMRPSDRRADAFSKANLNAFSSNAGDYRVAYSNINTDNSEYSPMYYQNGLIFVSNRQQKNRYVFQWDRTSYSDLYIVKDLKSIVGVKLDSVNQEVNSDKTRITATEDNSENSLLSLFASSSSKSEDGDEPYLLRSKIRSSYHEGPTALLPEGSLMFTRNNYVGGKTSKSRAGVNKLKLYIASGPSWDKITSFQYNNNEYSTGHPTISPDGNILIFTSDMPRGFGGTDLYYCVRTGEGKDWGRPVNLGPKINTEGNEQFPYLHKNGKLYFSSTGHPGLGGLDIFEVVLKDLKAVGKPKNLGSDINSSLDDFGYIQNDEGKTGFFSSNRRGNDDIYQFTKLAYNVKLKVVVTDADTNLPIIGSKVLMRHNGIVDTINTDINGEFDKVLAKETDYELSGKKMFYISKQFYASSTGIQKDSTIVVNIKLNRVQDVQQNVMDNCESLKKMFEFKNIYYDLDKYDIRPDSRIVLDEIAEAMRKNPEITIITGSHTDSRASESYNRKLSLKRGDEAKAYLISKGISGDRIEVKYYGKSRLINTCFDGVICPEEEQQKNRRTSFEALVNGVNISLLDCKVQ